MIEIKDLHKSYKTGSNSLHVLKGINFSVAEGELVSIMGSSGSGKSTLLNILGMLDEADSGTYTLDGVPIKNLNEKIAARYRNKFLGFIFQSFNLISYKSAVDNVALPLYYQGLKRRVYSGVPAGEFGLEQVIRIGHMAGRSNIIWWLQQRDYEITDNLVSHLFDVAKSQRRLMDDSEVVEAIEAFNGQ